MTVNYERFPRQFIVPHRLRTAVGGVGLIGCMDRRLVRANDPTLGNDRLFQQIRGGRFGTGHGLALTMEVEKPGSFTDLGIPVAQFAQGVGFVLETAGLLTTKHGPVCGAIAGAENIHNGVANGIGDQEMFKRAASLNPGLTESTYLQTAEAAQRISAAGLMSTPDEVKNALTTPRVVLQAPPTPHVDLEETDHDRVLFVADYRRDVALDRAAAHKEGWGAYYTSMGIIPDMRDALPDGVKVNPETWQQVEAVCLGRVATYDITHDGEPYPTEAIYA